MNLLVTYHRPQDIVRDYDEQLVRGGLLVRVIPPDELDLYAEVCVPVWTLAGQAPP